MGCLVDSCGNCENCRNGLESYCRDGRVLTYNDVGHDGELTYGGYSEKIVVDEAFAVKIPPSMPLESAAPLMCAGITLYSPLRHWRAGSGTRVAIIGMGGLGHVGVQLASALGATTVVINKGSQQADDARRLGADSYYTVGEPACSTRLPTRLILSSLPFRSATTSMHISDCLIKTECLSTLVCPTPRSASEPILS